MDLISSDRRRDSEMKGRLAEAFVAEGWASKGFAVLGQRVRTSAGEIDLVVADLETLVFVEVKARRTFSEAAYAVSQRQQRRLVAAADYLLATNPDWCRPSTRFDVALVCGGVVEQIEDAIRLSF
jgi:putative endonuclease